jgi:hypothetical protein
MVFSDAAANLGRVIYLYDSYAFSLEASFVPAAVPRAGVSLTGSFSCARALVEFRFGAERLSAYAPSEDESCRLSLPEGDGDYYRSMDLQEPGGPRVLTDGKDASALAWVSDLLGSRFHAFPGGR